MCKLVCIRLFLFLPLSGYEDIQEAEHSTFTPFVLSLKGGIGREATNHYKCARLASLTLREMATGVLCHHELVEAFSTIFSPVVVDSMH